MNISAAALEMATVTTRLLMNWYTAMGIQDSSMSFRTLGSNLNFVISDSPYLYVLECLSSIPPFKFSDNRDNSARKNRFLGEDRGTVSCLKKYLLQKHVVYVNIQELFFGMNSKARNRMYIYLLF